MPYHPRQLRPAPWKLIGIAMIVGLLVGTWLWSFRAGRQQLSDGAPTMSPTAPAAATPAVPEPPGRPVP
jgi:hypothetical protein